MEDRYKETKTKALAQVSKAFADMWTSMDMDAYLAVTCHFITEEVSLIL